ncbi:hypothetical protein [Lactobacillus acetotolerans]|jgi:CHASE2 domain-containing sensor protein|uniref:DUF3955 domain-containing protein n=1 Tax=Lactobacillus acetotolerans TaxID=1600 RepID=A0A5P5ZJJ9_9LACO|nr:hypothetical protein [Lactobacillus acetotolerans]KRN37086.1 hypothetical protein FC77_GL001345 [Lactobacillus acetotolerans DSM 20749 = JCM 3825]MBN7276934.1 hypothetical protein [Lactobacillus acetotolerans]QFG51613.1 DUF3955 domain-containing protein [Lactobacillus acetotolerans]QJD73190.1 DUF3955 domain-containing protein [Lactobacillus acetotolerans]GGV18591.1 hypothetical protein GCM10011628_14780 [Lactobacillus acetotolerans DSM 20749 = JCM 3825]
MKRYKPNTKAVITGITFMIIGITCWCIKALVGKSWFFLLPTGLFLICVGGLTLTVTAFLTLRKNDLRMLEQVKKKRETEKKNI